jgi:hypothetical protein
MSHRHKYVETRSVGLGKDLLHCEECHKYFDPKTKKEVKTLNNQHIDVLPNILIAAFLIVLILGGAIMYGLLHHWVISVTALIILIIILSIIATIILSGGLLYFITTVGAISLVLIICSIIIFGIGSLFGAFTITW